MSAHVNVLADQLGRMRGMTRYYHERFFADTRFVTIAIILLLIAGWEVTAEAFLLVPVVALIGANQTAFDASYLVFARTYAERLEAAINETHRANGLVAAKLEDRYLFPLSETKIVTIPLSGSQTWFGWITIFYTVLGVTAFVSGLALGWPTLESHGTTWVLFYGVSLAVLTAGSLWFGYKWFVKGDGESRLREILDSEFKPHPQR